MNLKLRSLRLKSGESVAIADGLTVIVGPNNAGKSMLLRELNQYLHSGANQNNIPNRVLSEPVIDKVGSVDDFMTWIRANLPVRSSGTYPEGLFSEEHIRTNTGLHMVFSQLRASWQHLPQPSSILNALASIYSLYLDAQSRLAQQIDGSAFNAYKQQAAGVAQVMYQDRAFEKEMSDLLYRAFGENLTLNRYASPEITVHVGTVQAHESVPPVSKEYLAELNSLPRLSEQGDGFRAFACILFALKLSRYPLVIIDEPEAFLHPPQAYMLGKILAEQHAAGTQVLVATHSADIIRGITSSRGQHEVSITRLTRSWTTNHTAGIEPAKVRQLYNDPLIKYYPILDGLFAKGVIVCEGESDCTYYRAVLESAMASEGNQDNGLDFHFTHCNGKARVGRAVDALRLAEVPVVAILDIDFLCEDKDFEEIVRAQGGEPDYFKTDRSIIRNSVESWGKKVDRTAAKALVDKQFDRSKAPELSNGEISKIKEAVSPVSGWREFKRYGKNHLSGNAVGAFESLDQKLREIGIFVVPCGVLERFHPELSSDNKAEWLRTVLESEKYSQSQSSKDFVSAVAQYIASKQ